MQHADNTQQHDETQNDATQTIIDDRDFGDEAERRRTESAAEATLAALVRTDVDSGLIESDDDVPGTYAPKLIVNRAGTTMRDELGGELEHCADFDISVAFVTPGSVRDFLKKSLLRRDPHAPVSGHIITSTKGYFNDPSAFKELQRVQELTGVEVRVWLDSNESTGKGAKFHPKGYIFTHRTKHDAAYVNLYIGSSNLTDTALSEKQREWNLKVSSLPKGDIVRQVREEIDRQVSESEPLTKEWLKQYEEDFKKYSPKRREILEQVASQDIQPNAMQREVLENLQVIRTKGEPRAIVISATGTGKTYLSAFDVRRFKPKRMLYIAQQQQILVKSRESFQKVLGCSGEELGLFTGNTKQQDRKYVFATIQTLSQPDVLAQFAPDEFDYILMDEVHHAGAATYQRVMDHFSGAKFILGMTATPERMDGINIFEMFNYQVAGDIRLQRALDEDMLCPFEYYGVAEYLGEDGTSIDVAHGGKTGDDAGQLSYEIKNLAFDGDDDGDDDDDQENPDTERIRRLTSKDRVRYIIDMIQKYGRYDQPVTGLVFCSRNEEAERLSDMFNQCMNQQMERPYRTAAVTSSRYPNPKDREPLIEQLENGELDYLFTVDIFNEGVDIPALNQIIMLRNTESSIVFTQQLGRGLRKFPHKDRVVIIDFIGNYANNYLIPVALYGNTGDRDTARRNLQRTSIGLSTISFDRISEERILKSLDTANWTEMKKMADQYQQVRYELGRIPMLADVYKYDPSLPPVIALVDKDRNYLSFVRAQEKRRHARRKDSMRSDFYEQLDPVSDVENGILKMATAVLLPGARPHELVILDELCRFSDVNERIGDEPTSSTWELSDGMTRDEFERRIIARFPEAHMVPEQMESALHVLDFSYFDASFERFGSTPLIERDGDDRYRLSTAFARMLRENRTFRIFFADMVRVGLKNCRDRYDRAHRLGRRVDRGFLYEEKYSLAEIMRMLGWQRECNGQMVGGYLLDAQTNTMPIFVRYASSQYEDRFINSQEMLWYSKNKRSLTSREFRWLLSKSNAVTGTGQGEGDGGDDWDRSRFVPLFIMRREEVDDLRTKPFRKYYYVGHVVEVKGAQEMEKPDANGEQTKVVRSMLRLDRPLDPELYRHITGTRPGEE